jgi:UDP-N-acetylglucosamine 2-epimerase (non-hydrolysing)
MPRILTVIGTRPNFIKVTQFRKAAQKYPGMEVKFVHTGQHYDGKMADIFFQQFGLIPDYFLNVQPGTANTQMAHIMIGLEKVVTEFKPDLLVVVGDVNSTMAASITANKMNVKLAHVESGLRSFDLDMPEEWNRLVTDQLARIYFVSEPSGEKHLLSEGKPKENIYFVGNTMIDTMVAFSAEIEKSDVLETMNLTNEKFVLMTMHRPSNVDSEAGLKKLLQLINHLSAKYSIVFPVHPRTVARMKETNLHPAFAENTKLRMIEPLDYFAFQKLIRHCSFILTDSGGIQEESTFMQVPCLTLRENTERPVTVTEGTNVLVKFEAESVFPKIAEIENGTYKKGKIPHNWDGKATERIFEILNRIL